MASQLELRRTAFNKISIVVTLLSGLVLLHNYHRVIDVNFSAEDLKIKHKISHELQENFVWSEELDDWAVDVEEASRESEACPKRALRCIWPEDCVHESGAVKSDRIIEQLLLDKQSDKTFKIHIQREYNLPVGADVFLNDECRVNRCELTSDIDDADAIVFQNADVFQESRKGRRSQQIWIAYLLESPNNTFDRKFERKFRGKHVFNWTASYRSDSDIVTPYSKYVPYSSRIERYLRSKTGEKGIDQTDFLKHKKRKVAWFVSNCETSNNRLQVAKTLSKYIQVDTFGACGNKTCSKSDHKNCLRYINENYKFYLSFENSNCNEYITEKLYQNALGYNDLDHKIVPIVMGAPKEDYLRFSPPNSIIHISDSASMKDLADYLNELDRDDDRYLDYFRWKSMGRFINTKFLCRLCAMLHQSQLSGKQKYYKNLKDWWTKGSGGDKEQCES